LGAGDAVTGGRVDAEPYRFDKVVSIVPRADVSDD